MGATIYHGDCLAVMPTLPAASVDLILADLPYGTTQCRWDSIIPFATLWKEYKRLLKPAGCIILHACQPFTSSLIMSQPKLFRHELIWDKVSVSGFLDANRRPLRRHESLLVFARGRTTYNPQMVAGKPYTHHQRPGKAEHYGPHCRKDGSNGGVNVGVRYPTTIVQVPRTRSGRHPTEKPVALSEWLIKTYSNPGDTVLDNVMGTGGCGVAATNTGRNFIGIELDQGYFAIAQERIAAAGASATDLRTT